MAAKILPVLKLATKVTVAGGALYVVYDSGLLGGSEQGSDVLEKSKAAIPPAINEWMKYFGLEPVSHDSTTYRQGRQPDRGGRCAAVPVPVPAGMPLSGCLPPVPPPHALELHSATGARLQHPCLPRDASVGLPSLPAQVPTLPKVEFSPVQAWNSGVRSSISALSEAPTKLGDYTNQGLQYLKDLNK